MRAFFLSTPHVIYPLARHSRIRLNESMADAAPDATNWLLVYLAIWGLLFPSILLYSAYFKIRQRADAPFEALYPGDSRIPVDARAFWRWAWTQLEPLGFTPAAYLGDGEYQSNVGSYLALFLDSASHVAVEAKYVAIRTALGVKALFLIELSTAIVGDVKVITTNNNGSMAYWSTDRRRHLSFPCISDLGDLMRFHDAHVAAIGIEPREPLPAPENLATHMVTTRIRDFEHLEDAGVYRKLTAEHQYGLRLRHAITIAIIAFLQAGHIYRSILRYRARRWLSKHSLLPNYPTASYKRMIKDNRDSIEMLPMPAWYPPPVIAPVAQSVYTARPVSD